MLNIEEGDNEGPVYPPDFTPQQVEIYPRRSSITINPPGDAAMLLNLQARSGSNPGANFVNPAIPDFDETARKEKMNDELPKQLEEN